MAMSRVQMYGYVKGAAVWQKNPTWKQKKIKHSLMLHYTSTINIINILNFEHILQESVYIVNLVMNIFITGYPK